MKSLNLNKTPLYQTREPIYMINRFIQRNYTIQTKLKFYTYM